MTIEKDNTKLPFAKQLRRDMTPHERKLWYLFLRPYPVKVYKQRIIESYIVDFYCASARLVIEIDGSQHYEDESMRYDQNRTEALEKLGLFVLRFSNHEIDADFPAVCEMIDRIIRERVANKNPLSQLR